MLRKQLTVPHELVSGNSPTSNGLYLNAKQILRKPMKIRDRVVLREVSGLDASAKHRTGAILYVESRV
eukprot:scaffold28762_cov38-Tisochrysis_lutea.AAC.2